LFSYAYQHTHCFGPHSMTHLPLQTLPAFRVAARLQNLRAAALQLHLTHSAVSQQIKLLETQIGVPLFDRRGRNLVLNTAGAALLRAVEPALDRLADGLLAAQAAAAGAAQLIKLSVLPSFAQRWLLPRMARWQARHPDISLDVHPSQRLVDLQREGFHAGLRVGAGPWRGLRAHCLMDSPLVAVGAPVRAARLQAQVALGGQGVSMAQAMAQEPLLGDAERWRDWLALDGVKFKAKTVADFNDAGLMLQAAEHDLGIALARELVAADSLQAGSLVRLTPQHKLRNNDAVSYWLVCPTELAEWPPLLALHAWLLDEMRLSRQQMAKQHRLESRRRKSAP
jgi:LysR family transcriptional regulator, glycine cleavage system transcriptional activator